MKRNSYLIILLLVTFNSIISQTTHNISNPEDLTDLDLAPGDEVVLSDGVYNSDERIKFIATGTEENPIIFRAETPGGVQFTGGLQMDIAGEYLVVDGFYWNGGIGASNFIQFRNGENYAEHCTIQNCAINGLQADPDDAAEALAEGSIIKHRWIVLYGNYNSVLNCTFMNKNTAGALVLTEYEYNASTDGTTNTRCEEVGHTISNNYFYNFEKQDSSLSNAGDSETIRIGTSEYQNVNSGAIVSGNYFVQADGENEIITNKSMNNSYVNNTFRRCRGSLVMRHGSDATVTGNYFLGESIQGTGGIRIADSNHQITNNYIQDCIDTSTNLPWNNGLTFVGGNTRSVQDCGTTSVTNAYQDVENINFSNNTFINTHSPIYFNATRDGADDVFGSVTNNLIYFEANNSNISDVIEGSYDEVGSRLTFSGNIYNSVTTLEAAIDGFSEESISVTADGEIFTHNQPGKGASISNGPITDNMVGNGVGACFLDYSGENTSNSDCGVVVIEPIDSMTISNIDDFSAEEGSQVVTITSNISWEASSDNDWISISTTSGEGNSMLTVTVQENTSFEDRTGSVTFNQVNGSLIRVLSVSQNGVDARSNYILINDGSASDNVSVYSFYDEEVDPSRDKNNLAIFSLDKDFSTNWSGDGSLNGDNPDEFIYDLGRNYDLTVVDFASSVGKTYEFQIWVSDSGTEDDDFVNAFPNEENLISTNSNLEEFTTFVLPEVAVGTRYVKIVAFGQPSTTGSAFTTITEIEFYRTDEVLSVNDFTSAEALGIVMYPNPTTDKLYINRETSSFTSIKIHNVIGIEVMNLELDETRSLEAIDLTNFSAGVYFVEISNGLQKAVTKIIVAN